MIDELFAHFKWYRKMRKGCWYYVSLNASAPWKDPFWTRTWNGNKILKSEVWN